MAIPKGSIDLGIISLAKSLELVKRATATMNAGEKVVLDARNMAFDDPPTIGEKPVQPPTNYGGFGTGRCFDCQKPISRNKARCMACQTTSGKLEDRDA